MQFTPATIGFNGRSPQGKRSRLIAMLGAGLLLGMSAVQAGPTVTSTLPEQLNYRDAARRLAEHPNNYQAFALEVARSDAPAIGAELRPWLVSGLLLASLAWWLSCAARAQRPYTPAGNSAANNQAQVCHMIKRPRSAFRLPRHAKQAKTSAYLHAANSNHTPASPQA